MNERNNEADEASVDLRDEDFGPGCRSTQAETSLPRQWLTADILIGLVVLNGASAVVASLWIFVSIRLAALVMIFGAFGLFAGMIRRPRLVSTFLFFFILAGCESIVLEEYIVARFGGEERGVRVEEAARYHDAAVFNFANGAVRIDKSGVSSMTSKVGDSRTGTSVSYAAPYVPAGWTPEAPVTVWAVCHISRAGTVGATGSSTPACGDFGVSSGVAVAVPESGFFRAVDDAIEKHNLKTAEHALLVQFVEDPAAYIYQKQKWSIRFPIIINIFFVLAVVITGVLMNRKKNSESPS